MIDEVYVIYIGLSKELKIIEDNTLRTFKCYTPRAFMVFHINEYNCFILILIIVFYPFKIINHY
jgi:hypothetical protein